MNEFIQLFLNNLLPVFLAVAAGYLAARFLKVNPRGISRVTFYIFTPCLIFTSIVESDLNNGDILAMSLFTSSLILIVAVIAYLVGKLLRLERTKLAAVVLTSMLINAGNFGLAVVNFGFGEQALAYASVFFVVNAIFAYTIGVFIASLGNVDMPSAFRNLLKVPAIYGVALGILFLLVGWRLPLPLESTVRLLGDAAIPTLLVLLGVQMYSTQWSGNLVPLMLSSTLRLVISPLIAFGLVSLFSTSQIFIQAGVLQAGMPTAVLTTLIATEYDLHPKFVTSVVFTTTLLSMFTLTPLLKLLGA